MRRPAHIFLTAVYPALALLLTINGCRNQQPDTVYQFSTIDALLAGVYEGNQSTGGLLEQGGQGIGTFNDLDGEMLVLDGKVYQVKSDGKVYEPDLKTLTPFATVCRFDPEINFKIDSITDFPALQRLLDRKAPNQNLICAIRISGRFKSVRTRSVPRQVKPFPPLSEVTAHQPKFQIDNVEGTIVGFRFPPFIKGVNMPGCHLHFLSSDHERGGHILSFILLSGTCSIDVIHRFNLQLPEGNGAFAATDLTKDRSVELQKAEGETKQQYNK